MVFECEKSSFLKEGGAATLDNWVLTLIVAVVVAIVFGVVGFVLGGKHRKKTAEGLIGSADAEEKRQLKMACRVSFGWLTDPQPKITIIT